MKRWAVELFKERYPFSDYSAKFIFKTEKEARNFALGSPKMVLKL